jgi:hypothetical protein
MAIACFYIRVKLFFILSLESGSKLINRRPVFKRLRRSGYSISMGCASVTYDTLSHRRVGCGDYDLLEGGCGYAALTKKVN